MLRDVWYILAGGTLTVGWMLAWFVPSWLGLPALDRWVLRGGLAVLVLLGALALLWVGRRKRAAAASQAGAIEGAADELDVLIREAERRLAAARGRSVSVENLPVVLLVGEAGSAKTSSMVHSGLDPELLAGQVYQETAIVPTRAVNIWLAGQTLFIEAGGKLLADVPRWHRLLRRLSPAGLAAVGCGRQAPRAALVMVDCEQFLRPDAADVLAAAARNLQARLGEISQTLGITLPVYVLFTKLDRVNYFAEFVRNLAQEETGQVFGVTLPMEPPSSSAVYAERETQRLTEAFNRLFHRLADRRLDLLPRETDAEKTCAAYEFPREFAKLRKLVVQFLVDLCRPSQLRSNPFLRGFYFSGVRAVVVQEAVPTAAAPRPAERPSAVAGATGMFRAGALQPIPAAQAPPAPSGTRRVPQWLFLTRLFHSVILQDRAALAASTASARASLWRRVALAAAAFLLGLFSIALIVSYFGNRALIRDAVAAARAARPAETPGQLASVESLRRLEGLRQITDTLARWDREGPPLRLRWGLYVGDSLYPAVRRVYFRRFYQLLFAETQRALLQHLAGLPPSPGPNDQYGPAYDALKAYLITTTHHDKSTRAFLSPVLFEHWAAGRDVGEERAALARRQFDFYSEELRLANPLPAEADMVTVERARRYLAQFGARERVYRLMLAEASAKNPPVSYHRLFPGFSQVVVNNREVPGAFTKAGWATMQEALKNVPKYFGGEEWVLGKQAASPTDIVQLEKELRELYRNDYRQQWRDFLKATSIARYASLSDAARKLALLAGNQAPLMALFWLVSENTAGIPEIAETFQPPQSLVPPGTKGLFIQPPNQPYMTALMNLQTALEAALASPGGTADSAAAQQTLAKAAEARAVTRQIALAFRPDPEGQVDVKTRTLMEDPITYVEALLRGLGPAELRAKAQAFCAEFRELMSRYPFNPKAAVQATVDDLNRLFRPTDGSLWRFYNESLQNLIVKQGGQWVAKPGGTMTATPAFLAFFNRAAAFSEAVYKGGQQPQLTYSLRSNLTGLNQSIELTIDGQTLSNGPGRTLTQQFTWPGRQPGGVRMTVRFGGEPFQWPRYDGLWAAFDFFADGEEKAQVSGSVYTLEWTLRTGQAGRQVTTATGQPVSVRLDLDMMGAPPVFRKGYFAGWNCVTEVAR
ncbi:MAG: ImcF-related family protein [Bryobacteraceae bacterium]